jgi:hypothetical protein
MKNARLAFPVIAAIGLMPTHSHAASVLAVADAELTESSANADGTAAVSGGNGTNPTMNYRWTGDFVSPGPTSANRNDMSAVRFDLSAYTLSDLEGLALTLTSYRAGTLNPARLYGMAADATPTTGAYTPGDWSESPISFNTMPGLTFDGLSTTRGLNLSQLTDLGTLSSGTLTKGQLVTFSSPAITSFVNSYPGTSVTFLIVGNAEVTGQTRFATREATGLDADPIGSVPAGTYAPTLTFTVVPEPSSLLLAAMGGLVLGFRRRS